MGGATAACLLLSSPPTYVHIYSSTLFSFHPPPPSILWSFFFGFLFRSSRFVSPPPLSLPRCGTRSACIPLVSAPRHLSFSRRLCLSVGNWQDGKRVDTERVKSRSGLNRKSRRKGEKCSCSSSAFTVSRCCCWLDVIRWDSVGENRSVLVEKLQSSIFIRTFLFPPRKRIAFLTSFSRLLFLFLGMPHIETNYTHIKASLRLTTHPLPPLPVHSEGVKVGRRWSYGIRTLSRRIKEISIKAVQPFRKQTHCCGPPTSQSLLVLNTF